jgi:hypothetical protein
MRSSGHQKGLLALEGCFETSLLGMIEENTVIVQSLAVALMGRIGIGKDVNVPR